MRLQQVQPLLQLQLQPLLLFRAAGQACQWRMQSLAGWHLPIADQCISINRCWPGWRNGALVDAAIVSKDYTAAQALAYLSPVTRRPELQLIWASLTQLIRAALTLKSHVQPAEGHKP